MTNMEKGCSDIDAVFDPHGLAGVEFLLEFFKRKHVIGRSGENIEIYRFGLRHGSLSVQCSIHLEDGLTLGRPQSWANSQFRKKMLVSGVLVSKPGCPENAVIFSRLVNVGGRKGTSRPLERWGYAHKVPPALFCNTATPHKVGGTL